MPAPECMTYDQIKAYVLEKHGPLYISQVNGSAG